VKNLTSNPKTDQALQVLYVVVNIPCNDQIHCQYKEWLPSGKCPLKMAGNI
jgi:hypothetical protein